MANPYQAKYEQHSFEQLWAMIHSNASVESVQLAALPWKSVRETLEGVNEGTNAALERLMSGWTGHAANEFRDRVGRLMEYTESVRYYVDEVENQLIPDLAAHLSKAQERAATFKFDASRMGFEEWSATRMPWEMSDRPHYENERTKDRKIMAAIVGELAQRYDEQKERIRDNPPPLPAQGVPGANAGPPGGSIFNDTGLNAGSGTGGAPPLPAQHTAPSGSGSGGTGGVEAGSHSPPLPAGASEADWSLSAGEDGESAGGGLYSGTAGATVAAPGAAGTAAPTGAAGAGAGAMGVAGATAAGANAGASGRGGATGTGAARGGAGAGRGAMPGGSMAAAGGGAGKGAAGAAGRGGGGTAGAMGGRPADGGEDEESKDLNWLNEDDMVWAHFDPNAGPADDHDPKAVREWERMYDRWKELKESGEA
ncbi:hypothetical protein [Natronoglycomyces albus]|uniref:PPE family domain-containing protein n=1 Tax=Natronoglycomyces albus TaxID=2811108 RepID=A0A895XHY1_9ACTN|nr:hypothetical protein [Natronoglycomyces albus]QSB05431.1 hypothetical protein JQS30_00340 [Natronoglycomyces albus]